MQETLRLHPPAPMTSRCASQDITLCGVFFPAGTAVHIDIMGLHMDPRCWHEPHKFRPERFLKVGWGCWWLCSSWSCLCPAVLQ